MSRNRSASFLVFGQSYGRLGYNAGAAYVGLCQRIWQAIDSDPAAVSTNIGVKVAAKELFELRNVAVDGTAIIEMHAGAAGYWVEDGPPQAIGPWLSDALADINGYSDAPVFAIWSQGEQDAVGMTDYADAARVKSAIEDVLWPEIRAAISPADPDEVPIFVDMLGPRFAGCEFSEYAVRDVMIEALEADECVFRGAEKYALQLDRTAHPTEGEGDYQMGSHTGRVVKSWMLDRNDVAHGPSITGAVKTGSSVVVSINVPKGQTLLKPDEPDFFGLFDAAENRVPVTGFGWSGNTLTIMAANDIAVKLRYPCPTGKRLIDHDRIIRLADPSGSEWIYPGEPGLVLESTKTIEL